MEWALVDGQRVKAKKSGTIGVCPGCGGEVRAKCGEIVSWHWAHINADCDPWSELETDWHRKWKGYFPDTWQEVTKPPHRADVAGPDGVLEIQRSPITPKAIREREQFYGRMAWLLNGHDFWDNLEWIKAAGSYHEFRWKHARKTWITAKRTILIDTPLGLFRVKNIRDGSWKVICGSFVKAANLTQALDASSKTSANTELLLYDSFAESARKELFAKADELNNLYSQYKLLIENLYGYAPPPRWRGWLTAHEFTRKIDLECLTDIFDYYKAQTKILQAQVEQKEKEALRIQMEREEKMREKMLKRAEMQVQLENARKIQQAINKAANERIAAAMMTRGLQ